jgi:hypothetical protein
MPAEAYRHNQYTMNQTPNLNPADLEAIERLISRNGDDLAISIARSFERLEERIDATESRLYARLAEVEDRIEAARREAGDQLAEIAAAVKAEA